MHFLCLALLFAIAVLYFVHQTITSKKVAKWQKAKIPFIKPTPLIGCKILLDLRKRTLAYVMDKIYRENSDKDLVAFFSANAPFVLLRDPKLIKKIFAKNSDKLFRNGFRPLVTDIETQSVSFLSSDKTQWKKSRNNLDPFFAASHANGLVFAGLKTQIDKLWHYSEQARLKGQPINLKEFASNFVADSTAAWGFSEDTNCFEQRDGLYEVVDYVFAQTPGRLFTLFVHVQWPWMQVFERFKIIPQKYIDFMGDLLKRKMKIRRENGSRCTDAIDYFISLKERRGGAEKGISFRQMTGYSLTVLLAGIETTTHLCLFSVYLLSLYPEHQERIKEEIRDVQKKHNVSGLTFEVVRDLQFTEQCIMETARLYPFFALIMRECSEDFQIQGTAYSLRKGEKVLIIPYAMQRDPKYFKDPDKFDPERFNPENRSSIPPDVFINFGIGHRKCPGYMIGLLVAVTFAASLVSKYEIKPRSHLRLITAVDFDSKGFNILPKGELLVDLILR